MIEYAEARAGCAGRGDGRECEERSARRVGEYLAGVDSLAAADCENHVRVRNFGLEHLNILDRCFAAVPERTDNFNSGFLCRCDYLILRRGECVLAADYRRLFAVCRADFFYILILPLPLCIIQYFLTDGFVFIYKPFTFYIHRLLFIPLPDTILINATIKKEISTMITTQNPATS